MPHKIKLIRSTEGEKRRHVARLRQALIANQNVLEVLVTGVCCFSLGQIAHAQFGVGASTGGLGSVAAGRS